MEIINRKVSELIPYDRNPQEKTMKRSSTSRQALSNSGSKCRLSLMLTVSLRGTQGRLKAAGKRTGHRKKCRALSLMI